jgi:hypothetical protein
LTIEDNGNDLLRFRQIFLSATDDQDKARRSLLGFEAVSFLEDLSRAHFENRFSFSARSFTRVPSNMHWTGGYPAS